MLLSTGSGLLGTAPSCSSWGPSPEMENLGSGLLEPLEWWLSRPLWSFLLLVISGDMSSLSVWLESVSERDCGAEDCLDGGGGGSARLGTGSGTGDWDCALATMISRSGHDRWAEPDALEISVLELLLLLEADSVLLSIFPTSGLPMCCCWHRRNSGESTLLCSPVEVETGVPGVDSQTDMEWRCEMSEGSLAPPP